MSVANDGVRNNGTGDYVAVDDGAVVNRRR